VVSKFLELTVIREILTLLINLHLEIAKASVSPTKIYIGPFSSKITFAPTSIAASLKRQSVSWGFSDGCVYRICSKQVSEVRQRLVRCRQLCRFLPLSEKALFCCWQR